LLDHIMAIRHHAGLGGAMTRVLHVVDDEVLGRTVRRAIGSFNDKISWVIARSASEAVAMMDADTPDALLIDLSGVRGHQAALHVLIEARSRGLWVNTVILTNELTFDVVHEAQALQACIVEKPDFVSKEIRRFLVRGKHGYERGRTVASRLVAPTPGTAVPCSSQYDRIAAMCLPMNGKLREHCDAIEIAIIERAIRTLGSKRAAAKRLGVTRTHIDRKLRATVQSNHGANLRSATV